MTEIQFNCCMTEVVKILCWEIWLHPIAGLNMSFFCEGHTKFRNLKSILGHAKFRNLTGHPSGYM